MKCKKGFEVQPMRSPIGYYMGTIDDDGFPNCRISAAYAKTREEALKLPLDRQCGCIENDYCNGGKGCFRS